VALCLGLRLEQKTEIMETQKKYRATIVKRQLATAYQSICVNLDGLQSSTLLARNGLLLALFLVIGIAASAKPKYFGPSFGYHHHHYVYYPKQNFYYDPYVGTYVVYERGVWVRQLTPPRLLLNININVLPHVDVYEDTYYPHHLNHEHRHKYRLIYLVAPSTTFYVFRMPRRYDFTITPYTYYHGRPPRHIAYYNPNYYCHRDKYPYGYRHGKGHAYGHDKHRPYYAYNRPYERHPRQYHPFGAKPHDNENHGGPAFGGLGKPQKTKQNGNNHSGPFGTMKQSKNSGSAKKGNNPKPFGTIPQNKKAEPMNNGRPNSPAHPSKQNRGNGNGKGGKKNFSEPQGSAPNNENWQKPGGNRERNMQKQNKNSPQTNQEVPQRREARPANNPNAQRQERNIQYSQRSAPNENRGGGNSQQRPSNGGKSSTKGRGKS